MTEIPDPIEAGLRAWAAGDLDALESVERARQAAKAGHRARFDSADLLLGLLDIDDGMAVRLLRNLGVDPAAVRARLRPRAA